MEDILEKEFKSDNKIIFKCKNLRKDERFRKAKEISIIQKLY